MRTLWGGRDLRRRPIVRFHKLIEKLTVLDSIAKAEMDSASEFHKPSSFHLIRLLPPKAKLIVKAIGLDKDTNYEVFKQTLIKLCRPEPNLPRLSTFMSREFKPEDDIEVHAMEIQAAVECLLTHPITEELIEFISLDAYTYSSSPQLAQYLTAKNPKTIKEAIRLTHKFKDMTENNKLKMDIKTIEKKIESMCPYVGKLFAQEGVKFSEKLPKKEKILLERNSLD